MEKNPITDSVLRMTVLSLSHELRVCYDYAEKKLGVAFVPMMQNLVEVILNFKAEVNQPDLTFVTAGILLTLPTEEDPKVTVKDKEKVRFIKAAIEWGIRNGRA